MCLQDLPSECDTSAAAPVSLPVWGNVQQNIPADVFKCVKLPNVSRVNREITVGRMDCFVQ